MYQILLSIGSNINPEKNIVFCIQELKKILKSPIHMSSVYQTPPIGYDHQDYFYNLILHAGTVLSLWDLKDQLNQIEHQTGRIASVNRYGPRTLDIDLLDFDGLVLNQQGIQLPHEQLRGMPFVLVPLVEIFPLGLYPGTHETYRELLNKISTHSYSNFKKLDQFTQHLQNILNDK